MAGVLQGRGEAGSPAQTLPPVAGAWVAGELPVSCLSPPMNAEAAAR